MANALSLNMQLLAHHELEGFGGVGEGMGMQLARDGRRILWLAHESAPKNFTAVDVSDPRNPRVVVQTELPHAKMRSNSLDVVGDTLAVAYQTSQKGLQPAGFDLFDIADPEKPRLISHFDCSGPHSRGVHVLWFVDGEYIHMSAGAPDFQPRNPLDDQFYRIVDVRNPSKPVEVGRWWLPGTREGDEAPPPRRLERKFDAGFRAHNTNVYPARPDRAYVGYIDGGALILDIADKAQPKVVAHWRNSPPFNGFTHTVLPLLGRNLLIVTDECVQDGGADWPKVVAHWRNSPPFNGFTHTVLPLLGRNLLVVTDECVQDGGADWPKLVWVLDARLETNPVPIATLPAPPYQEFVKRGGRFGAHNLHENLPVPGSWRSEQIVIGSFFNAGVRAYDLLNPYQPKEVAYFVPPAPNGARTGAVQLNDVYVDDRRIVYSVDRHIGGLYVLELTL